MGEESLRVYSRRPYRTDSLTCLLHSQPWSGSDEHLRKAMMRSWASRGVECMEGKSESTSNYAQQSEGIHRAAGEPLATLFIHLLHFFLAPPLTQILPTINVCFPEGSHLLY